MYSTGKILWHQATMRFQFKGTAAISLQAVGSPKEAPPTYIAKMW